MKKFTLLACGICGLLHAGDPIVEWSFDESIHADRGGTGIVQDIASKKGAAGVKATVSGTKRRTVFWLMASAARHTGFIMILIPKLRLHFLTRPFLH